MAKNRTAKNLLTSRDTYNRYYGDFRGVDFASDHTQVSEGRLAFAVNMYRDYNSGGGKALETVPGFRRRVETRADEAINGIHEYRYRGEAPEKRMMLTVPDASTFRYRENVTFEPEIMPERESDIELIRLYRPAGDLGNYELGADFMLTQIDTESGIVELMLTTDFTGAKPGATFTAVFEVGGSTTSTQVTLYNKSSYRHHVALPENTEIYEYIRTENEKGQALSATYNSYSKEIRISAAQSMKGEKILAVYREKKYEAVREVLVHRGHRLLRWKRFPLDVGLTYTDAMTLPAPTEDNGGIKLYTVFPTHRTNYSLLLENVTAEDGTDITLTSRANGYYLTTTEAVDGDNIRIEYIDVHGERHDDYGYPRGTDDNGDTIIFTDYNPETIISAKTNEENPRDITDRLTYHRESVTISGSTLQEGDTVYVKYKTENELDIIRDATGLADRKSTSFMMNNRLYILDGIHFAFYERGGIFLSVTDDAYVPTTYINTIPAGANADIGAEYQQRNLLSDDFRQTFIADGETTEFYMNEPFDYVGDVKLYGKTTYTYTVDTQKNSIIFDEAPMKAEDAGYPEGYAGIEITATKPIENFAGTGMSGKELINGCTLAAVYDGRVFLSGNHDAPNLIFYCERNAEGVADPSYFGILNYMQDGTTSAEITALLPLADTLAVLKEKSTQDGTVFYHTPTETGNDVQPKIYPSQQGLSGTGCLGAAASFLDDPVFISDGGLEAIGQLSVRYERAIEHRSSLVDTKLSQLDLTRAQICEWNGYLCISEGGAMFLADSRQRYADEYGNAQYEWYYLEDIGAFKGQYTEYTYSARVPTGLEGKTVKYCTACKKGARECTCGDEGAFTEIPLSAADAVYDAELDRTHDLRGKSANPPDEDGKETTKIFRTVMQYSNEGYEYPVDIYYTVHDVRDRATLEHVRYDAYLCETKGAQTGGTFSPATVLKVIDGSLYFGTEHGKIFCFNTDKRDENGEIAPEWYTFDGRTIHAGCATKMDNCGIPHLTKSTVKRSTVIKTKTFADSTAKIKVRTNKKPYEQIARINSKRFAFDDMDFSDFSFVTGDQTLFSIKEKEKKWVEKQYYIYTDEFKKPFALYYVCYRYTVAGRYKE